MFLSSMIEEYTKTRVINQQDASRRFELANELEMTKINSNALVNVLSSTTEDLNDQFFIEQAKIIERVEQTSFNVRLNLDR